jgi:hypothetical protein
MTVRRTKRSTRTWFYTICYILGVLVGIICYCYIDGSAAVVMVTIAFHLITFAKSIVDTALVDEMLYAHEGKMGNLTVRAPRFIQKIYLSYPGSCAPKVHLSVLLMQLIIIACTIASLVLGALYVTNIIVKNDLFSPDICGKISLILLFITLLTQGIRGIIVLYKAMILERKEKKNGVKKRTLLDSIKLNREYKQWQKDWAWQKELLRSLQNNCHKYKKIDHLLQNDIKKIEERILMPYSKYIVYQIESDQKGNNVLIIRAKQNDELIFQVPIKKHS